jgi:hypothetical protein
VLYLYGFLTALLFLPLWPIVIVDMAGSIPMGGVKMTTRRAWNRVKAVRFIGMKRIVPVLIALTLLVTAGLWTYSHLDPTSAGTCRQVALRFGPHPTVRECEPYGLADFGVPFGIAVVLLLLMSDGDYTVTTPFGTLTLKRRVAAAAHVLATASPKLEDRAQGGGL